MVRDGERAPAFSGVDQHGQPVSLDALRARGPVVLYFYPRDFTHVCTREACLFRDAHASLAAAGVTVVGVSVDDDASHRRFADANDLPFSLVSDRDSTIAEAYGVVRRLGPLTLPSKRVTFVIDRDAIVRRVLHFELSASRHVDGVMSALASLR